MRCALYARYSSDLQRESSVEDQIRKMPGAFADRKGWTVLDEYVRSDEEISGAALAGRLALESLLAEAKRRPATSRPHPDRRHVKAGSQCGDALKMVEILRFTALA